MRPWDNSRKPGWDMVRARLNGIDGKPMLFITANCSNLIRTLPLLQHDDIDAEDVDTTGEDHAGDTLRGACMSRPWYPPKIAPRPKITSANVSITQLLEDRLASYDKY